MSQEDKFEFYHYFENNILGEREKLTLSYGNDDNGDPACRKEGNYQIAICQDGKFAVTFDIANLRIRILENTDHRPFAKKKKKNNIDDTIQNDNESDEINKTVAYFKINEELDIDNLYKTDHVLRPFNAQEASIKNNDTSSTEITEEKINHGGGSLSADTTKTKEKQRWSLDISNIQSRGRSRHGKQKHTNDEYIIFVAVSRINDGDMNGRKDDNDEDKDDDEKDKDDYEKDNEDDDKVKNNWMNYLEGKKEENGKLGKKEYSIMTEGTTDTKIDVSLEEETNKRTAIYFLKLIKGREREDYVLSDVTFYYSSISGICRFINEDLPENDPSENDTSNLGRFVGSMKQGLSRFINKDSGGTSENNVEQDKSILKRFIVLNAHGIYNYDCNYDFSLNEKVEKFDYPKNIKDELKYKKKDCMDKLLTCLYNQYFLDEQYQNNIQALDVYNLAEMDLKITAKRDEKKDKHIRKYNKNTFSISKLQLCFTRGHNSIKLYLMENGLETASKSIDEIEQIYSLEFIDSDDKLLIIGGDSEDNDEKLPIIGEDSEDKDQKNKELKLIIWDLYNTENVGNPITLDNFLTIKDLTTRLARTSGNILQVDDKGKVTSVLKKIEIKLKQNKIDEKSNLKPYKLGTKPSENHKIYFDKSVTNYKSIVDEKEPWMEDYEDFERNSYFLKATNTETLQLIVGRSTVQLWHQIHSDLDDTNKKKDELPNKGEPFLEYIWTNDIPVYQERKKTRLRIEDMKYNDSSNDFCLEVYWYERVLERNEKINENINKINEKVKDKQENEERIMGLMKEVENKEDKEIEIMEKEKNKTKKNKENKTIVRYEKTIRWKYINEKVKAVKHACEALLHLNKRKKFLGNSYIKKRKYEEMVVYIKHIIWRFVKHKPDQFRLMDVRYNVMKNLILGDCNHLIKFILFGDEENKDENGNKKIEKEEEVKKHKIIHIPKNHAWPGKEFIKGDDLDYLNRNKLKKYDEFSKLRIKNNLELAIYNCEGLELKKTIIIAYLLEYYSKHATDDAGWMSTVSKALPLLFKYNYDDYARKLFRKECFADHHHFSAQDTYEIIPEKYLSRRNHHIKFLAFRPRFKLKSDKQENRILKLNTQIYEYYEYVEFIMYDFFKGIDEDVGRPPLALRVVPLPEFTRHKSKRDKVDYGVIKIISNILRFVFIPRMYKIGRRDKNLLSPFSEMIRYENNDDIYDNPATEAVIDFRWRKARNFYFFLFLRFLVFAFCFGLVCLAYLNHNVTSEGFLIAPIVIFYYLAIYLLSTELIQFRYYGFKKYLDIYNIFDIVSIVLPVIIMSIMIKQFQFSDGFGSVSTVDAGLIVGISFSFFLLWIETVLHLRLISYIATYIYYFIIIIKTIFPFLLFFAIIIIGFANTMFVLLVNPNNANIVIKNDTLSGDVGNNSAENITLHSDFDPSDKKDNPFSFFSTAILASYYWLIGDMVQREHFDFWAVDLFTLIASVFLVIILLNMLIAFMSGVYEVAAAKGRQALLRYRANKIADYEALHHTHLWPHEPDPKYIYYIGQSNNFEEWYKNIKKHNEGPIYQNFEEKCTFTKYTFERSDYEKYSIWDYKDIKK